MKIYINLFGYIHNSRNITTETLSSFTFRNITFLLILKSVVLRFMNILNFVAFKICGNTAHQIHQNRYHTNIDEFIEYTSKNE